MVCEGLKLQDTNLEAFHVVFLDLTLEGRDLASNYSESVLSNLVAPGQRSYNICSYMFIIHRLSAYMRPIRTASERNGLRGT